MLRMSVLSNTNTVPDVESVEEMQLVPLIGQTLYDHLNTNYATIIAGSDVYTQLLKKLQKAIVPLAYLRDLPTIHVLITDAGVRTSSSSNMEAAHSWEYKALENGLQEKGMTALELAIRFLEKNKAGIAEWTSDEAYTKYNSLLIRGAVTFSEQYALYQPYRTFYLLKPLLFDVEENYLCADIGRALLSFLRTLSTMEVETEDGTVDVIKLVRKSVANFTIKHALKKLSVRFNEHGFTVIGQTGVDAEKEEIAGRTDAAGWQYEAQFREADLEGQNWLSRAKKILRGIGDGTYVNDWGAPFTGAFASSPLNAANESTTLERGNDKRKIFVF